MINQNFDCCKGKNDYSKNNEINLFMKLQILKFMNKIKFYN